MEKGIVRLIPGGRSSPVPVAGRLWAKGEVEGGGDGGRNDFMESNASGVFACGDAAEWRNRIYGVVPAAREQAVVAASNMVNPGSVRYGGTIPSVRLKVGSCASAILSPKEVLVKSKVAATSIIDELLKACTRTQRSIEGHYPGRLVKLVREPEFG